jgi:hypothetical protein
MFGRIARFFDGSDRDTLSRYMVSWWLLHKARRGSVRHCQRRQVYGRSRIWGSEMELGLKK